MSLPQRIAAYDDCFNIYEAAIKDGGVIVYFRDYGEANHFSMRMQMARSLQRDEAKRLYPTSDPRHGQSVYDRLTVRKPVPVDDDSGEWGVRIEPFHSKILAIQRLDAKEDPTEQLLLEGPKHDQR